MKALLCSAAVALVAIATDARAEYSVIVGGVNYPLVELMENCGSTSGGVEAQLKCFNTLTQMVREQSASVPDGGAAITQTLEALRDVAEYKDGESGLSITGDDCNVSVTYYNNYFHISRRNVSSIDLFGAEFDASRLQYDKTTAVQGQTMSWSKGFMSAGASAASRGGADLGSAVQLPQKPANATVAEYANAIVVQLPAREEQTFDFVLVHPKRRDASAEIWGAFEAFVNACQQ